MKAVSMSDPSQHYHIETRNGQTVLVLNGDWVLENASSLSLAQFPQDMSFIDASQIRHLDMWGTLQLKELIARNGADVALNEKQKKILAFIPVEIAHYDQKSSRTSLYQSVVQLGRLTLSTLKTVYEVICFIGEIFITLAVNFSSPRRFRIHSVIRHIDETGLRALPIVCLLAILISMVVSYQASTQLEKYGANIFVVDLTVISLLREMGVLITAVMVAGRSGSAFAAEIGVMKLREEVDALKTMGFNPVEVLVIPRMLAMLFTLPILAFLADIVGLVGGAGVAVLLLDIPLDQYVERVQSVATVQMFMVGLIKAPFFAFFITLIGTYRGLSVSGSAESIGRQTTLAVVQSIFLVIMADAIFSLIFAHLGL